MIFNAFGLICLGGPCHLCACACERGGPHEQEGRLAGAITHENRGSHATRVHIFGLHAVLHSGPLILLPPDVATEWEWDKSGPSIVHT
jgi:hypothetical protein